MTDRYAKDANPPGGMHSGRVDGYTFGLYRLVLVYILRAFRRPLFDWVEVRWLCDCESDSSAFSTALSAEASRALLS